MLKGYQKRIFEYCAQATLIVFSVVLGLYLNEKIANHNQYKESQKLLSHIKYEISQNSDHLNDWHPYHQKVYAKIDELSKSDTFLGTFIKDKNTLFAESMSRGTFLDRFPSGAAWEISKSNPNISRIDHEDMILLSNIYKQQELTFAPFDDMFKLINSSDFNSPELAQANLGIVKRHMREIVAREKQLLYYYEQAYSQLNIEAQESKPAE